MDDYVPFAAADEERRAQVAQSVRLAKRRRMWRSLRVILGLGIVAVLALIPLGLLPSPRLPDWVFTLGPPAPTAAPFSAPSSAEAPPVIPVPAEAVPATVDYVHDGDTLFVILNGSKVKVRLIGMDTPEIGNNAECYGDSARDVLRDLLPVGSTVSLAPDVEELDQYGRSLFYLWRDDGTFVNLSLLETGAGEFVVYPPNTRYSEEFAAAEGRAQEAGLGLWGACS